MSAVRDKITYEHAHFVRKRYYAGRDKVMHENQELQKSEGYGSHHGWRPLGRFPDQELERLADKARNDRSLPGWMAELDSKDPQTMVAARKKLMQSSYGKPYRVNESRKKSFFFGGGLNPLHRD